MQLLGRWLTWLNLGLIGAIALLLVASAFLWLKRPQEIVFPDPTNQKSQLPKRAFGLTAEAYQAIGEPLLTLQSAPPSIQVPDLRQQLIYYGKNGRPDAQIQNPLLHFSFNGSKAVAACAPGEKLYLIYDKKQTPARYAFSPNNEKTSLWLEATAEENEAQIRVTLQNEQGELISEPEIFAKFKLPEKEFIRLAGATWDIGTWRVDGTLLARQKARWYGPDKFLERHGGEEYQDKVGKQRIEFGENDEIYSVYIGSSDCLVWKDNRWAEMAPGEASLKYPLMVVKKIDERLMTLELWDVEGKGKVLINILKMTEPWMMQNGQLVQNTFKFVGARTRTQSVFEINHERMLISPNDWIIFDGKEWKKLETPDEIDDYVSRKLQGALFVFDELGKNEEQQQVMVGTLFNPSRSDHQTIEIPVQKPNSGKKQASEGDEEDDDDDDDDDDDEEEFPNAIPKQVGKPPESNVKKADVK